MDALLLPSRCTVPAISSLKVCRFSSGTQSGNNRVSFRTSYSYVQTDMMASFKKQSRSGKGKRMGAVEAKLATEEEVDDVSPSSSVTDNIAESVAFLKAAAVSKKASASEICSALRILDKAKIDPSGFLPVIGGTKSPGRTWMLIFNCSRDEYYSAEGGGKYFPITAVQNFDAEKSTIENGVFFGPLGSLAFTGSFIWEKRKLAFFFHTLKLTLGSWGPLKFGLGSKDRQTTKDDSFFIWYYADDEIIVAKGKAGGTAYWVRCTNVTKSLV